MKTKLTAIVIVLLFSFPVLLFSQKINYETKNYKDSNTAKRYHVSVTYPQIVNYSGTRVQDKINSIIQTEAYNNADEFTKEMQDWDLNDIPPDFGSEFDCNFTVFYSQNNIFSFAFEIYTYFAGAVHPYSYSQCMNLDLERVKKIDFTLMFKDENAGLKKLSDYCFNDLKKRSEKEDLCTDDAWLKEGTKPEVKNFENTAIEPDGLLVIFNSYQVACYAVGPQTIKIPYSALKDFINPNGPLITFIK